MNSLEMNGLRLQALVIFRKLREDAVISRLTELLGSAQLPMEQKVSRYAAFAAALFEHTANLTEYVQRRVMENDNFYVRRCAQDLPADEALEACLESELKTLEEVSRIDSAAMRQWLGYDGYLPVWRTSETDIVSEYKERLKNLKTRGYGIYASNRMFCVRGGSIVPVKSPDTVRLCDLTGYERQKKAVMDNTLALASGRPAANVLLYGDAGTGKSSTVKAVVNEYYEKGLRLIELNKTQCSEIPAVVDALRHNPLKFILFIDDLSFAQESDDYYALKAVVEGSASARTSNLAVYATSNRRHMVKERFSDREGDDVHRNETIQELSALSSRFGLTVGFFKPSKQQYMDIVHALKDQYGLAIDDETLELEAERFASAGRSPRVARQFIDGLLRAEK